jgi:hypothetical protein
LGYSLNEGSFSIAREASLVRRFFLSGLRFVVPGLLLVLFVLPLSAPAGASELFGPKPQWVSSTWLPRVDPARANQTAGGLYMLLLDRQENWHPGERDAYYRVAYQVQGREGLEAAASISETYDPTHESIRFHHLRIIRDGQTRDISGEASFATIRQERDLQSGMLTGELTLHAELDDIRVGDIVDYAYTISSKALVARDYYSGVFKAASSEPAGFLRFRLLVPMGTSLYQKADDGIPLSRTGQLGKSVVYERLVVNPEPQLAESSVPDWVSQWPRVEVSSLPGWSPLVEELLPAYEADANRLPADFLKRVDEIAARSDYPLERLGAATRLVQDTIRYVGIEIGTGSYIPRRPEEVVVTAYGDCKDKALLLATVLKRLGIEAHVALVNSYRGEALADDLPSPYLFDHAIVQAVVDGQDYWLDATLSQQGGTGANIIQAAYGYALPVKAGSTALVHMPVQTAAEPDASLVEEFEVPSDPKGPLSLTVTATYLGSEAERLRYRLSATSVASLQRSYDDQYGRSYPGAYRQGSMEVHDERERNEVSVINRFSVDHQDLVSASPGERFHLDADFIDGFLPTPPLHGRQFPVLLDFPRYRQQTTIIRGPNVAMTALEPVIFGNSYFSFRLTSEDRPGYFKAQWVLKILKPAAEVSDLRDYLRDVRSLRNDLWWEYSLTALYGKEAAGRLVATAQGDDGAVTQTGQAAADTAADVDRSTSAVAVDETQSAAPADGGESRRKIAVALAWFLGGFIGLSLVILLVRAWKNRKSMQAFSRIEGNFYPVSIDKYFFMSVLTLGVYNIFWFWRCFGSIFKDRSKISASFRAFLYFMWVFPLFLEARKYWHGRRVPMFLGILSALAAPFIVPAGVLLAVTGALLHAPFMIAAVCALAVTIHTVLMLPVVLAVNGANPPNSGLLFYNSSYGVLDVVIVANGLSWMFVSMVMVLNPT